ncbi:hypothetical protein GCM10027258_63270 [Amycolatopsis stemonae]
MIPAPHQVDIPQAQAALERLAEQVTTVSRPVQAVHERFGAAQARLPTSR